MYVYNYIYILLLLLLLSLLLLLLCILQMCLAENRKSSSNVLFDAMNSLLILIRYSDGFKASDQRQIFFKSC